MAIFNKKNSVNWEEKYQILSERHDKICEENRELRLQDI